MQITAAAYDDPNAILAALHRSQAIVEFAMDGTILTANENFLNALGFTLAEIEGKHHSILLAPGEKLAPEYQMFWDTLRRGEHRYAECRRIGKAGQTVWIRGSYTPVLDLDGKPIKVVKLATDITGEVVRREQMRMLSLVADATDNSVIITDVEGRIEYVNAGFARMTGFTFEEVRGRTPGNVLQGPATSDATRAAIRQTLAERQPFHGEIVNYGRDGRPYWIALSINPVRNDDGRVDRFVAIQTDISERKANEARIAFMATHDPLTGLGNRTMFHDRLIEARERRRPFALLCLDLDRFKQVNDTLGHPGGDQLLRKVADRLVDSVRPNDTVARLGGDEFAVILDEPDAADTAQAIALRIIKRIEAPFEIGDETVFIGVSVGIAASEGADILPDVLFQRADRALYCAKTDGRGTFRCFEPAMEKDRNLEWTLTVEAFS